MSVVSSVSFGDAVRTYSREFSWKTSRMSCALSFSSVLILRWRLLTS